MHAASNTFAQWTRWALSSALLLTLAASQLSGPIHFLLVQHVTCAEHGELIHADEQHPAVHPVAVSKKNSGVEARTDISDAHAHEHCLAEPVRIDAGKDVAVVSSQLHLVVENRVASVPAVVFVRAIAVYRLAPKNSPPA